MTPRRQCYQTGQDLTHTKVLHRFEPDSVQVLKESGLGLLPINKKLSATDNGISKRIRHLRVNIIFEIFKLI